MQATKHVTTCAKMAIKRSHYAIALDASEAARRAAEVGGRAPPQPRALAVERARAGVTRDPLAALRGGSLHMVSIAMVSIAMVSMTIVSIALRGEGLRRRPRRQ